MTGRELGDQPAEPTHGVFSQDSDNKGGTEYLDFQGGMTIRQRMAMYIAGSLMGGFFYEQMYISGKDGAEIEPAAVKCAVSITDALLDELAKPRP